MEKGLNFKTIESQNEYFEAYDKSLKLITIPFHEKYIETEFGDSHVICCGDKNNPPFILLHAASCGSPIWYPNLSEWCQKYHVFAIDLIGETSKSILKQKMNGPQDCAKWLDQTIKGLDLDKIYLCGLSIGGWNAINYACYYPDKISKLVLLSPVQTFAKMYISYFFKIMKMGFHPTRKNVENYIGWGSEKESRLPDTIIDQFIISVMNMNSNAIFPKFINTKQFKNLKMPIFVLFGENEFAFSINKAKKIAKTKLIHSQVEVVMDASHLLSFSKPDYINQKVIQFLDN